MSQFPARCGHEPGVLGRTVVFLSPSRGSNGTWSRRFETTLLWPRWGLTPFSSELSHVGVDFAPLCFPRPVARVLVDLCSGPGLCGRFRDQLPQRLPQRWLRGRFLGPWRGQAARPLTLPNSESCPLPPAPLPPAARPGVSENSLRGRPGLSRPHLRGPVPCCNFMGREEAGLTPGSTVPANSCGRASAPDSKM